MSYIQENALNMYLQQMVEIKKRQEVIRNICAHRFSTGFLYTDIEVCVLQVRKIIELIGMGSIISNREEYSRIYEKYSSNWNAKHIFRDVARINPNFYPRPIIVKKQEGLPDEFVDIQDGFLTKENAIKIYDKCGAFLHANNPYNTSTNICYYEEHLGMWNQQIVRLLNTHLVCLNDNNMYFIIMQSIDNGQPAGNIFERVI